MQISNAIKQKAFINKSCGTKLSFGNNYEEMSLFTISKEDKANLEYRVKTTPILITDNIRKSKNKDTAILQGFKMLSDESRLVDLGSTSMISTVDKFKKYFTERSKSFKSLNPTLSTIPLLGIIPQISANITGSFDRKIQRYAQNLYDESLQLLELLTENLHPLHQGFYESCDTLKAHLKDKPDHNKISDFLSVGQQKKKQDLVSISDSTKIYQYKLIAEIQELLSKQRNKQIGRAFLKTIPWVR